MFWEIILTNIILLNTSMEFIVDNIDFTNDLEVNGSEFEYITSDYFDLVTTPSEMVADKNSTFNPTVKHLENVSFLIGMFATFIILILLGISACLILCLFNTCKRMIKIVIV